jgi:hypothetical protein
VNGPALARVGIVLSAYALGAWLLLPMLDALQRVLFLPELFNRLARGALLLGVPVAIALAWRYPDVGDRGG